MVSTKQTGEVKNSIGNEEAKELICTTHGHEVNGRIAKGRGILDRVRWRREKNGTTIIASSIKYT